MKKPTKESDYRVDMYQYFQKHGVNEKAIKLAIEDYKGLHRKGTKIVKPKSHTPIVKPNKVDYDKYLLSDLWRLIIRPRIVTRDNNKCRVCENEECLQVHHIDYSPDTLAGKRDTSLITLCSVCHKEVEFNEMEEKRGYSEKYHKLQQMLGITD